MSTNEPTITIVGNLVAAPDLRFAQSGTAVANFTIAATPRSFDKASGQWKDGEALFMRCSLWFEPAENVTESLDKGMRVIATGRLQQRSFESKGEKRTVIEMQVDEIGPSLRYATAKVTKAQNMNGSGARPTAAEPKPADDPWTAQPAKSDSYSDTPPF